MNIRIPRQAGRAISAKRRADGLTRKQLAEKAGVSERSLAYLESGKADGVQLDRLMRILDALGLELSISDPSEESPEPPEDDGSSRWSQIMDEYNRAFEKAAGGGSRRPAAARVFKEDE